MLRIGKQVLEEERYQIQLSQSPMNSLLVVSCFAVIKEKLTCTVYPSQLAHYTQIIRIISNLLQSSPIFSNGVSESNYKFTARPQAAES
jgi:hypothetical protein